MSRRTEYYMSQIKAQYQKLAQGLIDEDDLEDRMDRIIDAAAADGVDLSGFDVAQELLPDIDAIEFGRRKRKRRKVRAPTRRKRSRRRGGGQESKLNLEAGKMLREESEGTRMRAMALIKRYKSAMSKMKSWKRANKALDRARRYPRWWPSARKAVKAWQKFRTDLLDGVLEEEAEPQAAQKRHGGRVQREQLPEAMEEGDLMTLDEGSLPDSEEVLYDESEVDAMLSNEDDLADVDIEAMQATYSEDELPTVEGYPCVPYRDGFGGYGAVSAWSAPAEIGNMGLRIQSRAGQRAAIMPLRDGLVLVGAVPDYAVKRRDLAENLPGRMAHAARCELTGENDSDAFGGHTRRLFPPRHRSSVQGLLDRDPEKVAARQAKRAAKKEAREERKGIMAQQRTEKKAERKSKRQQLTANAKYRFKKIFKPHGGKKIEERKAARAAAKATRQDRKVARQAGRQRARTHDADQYRVRGRRLMVPARGAGTRSGELLPAPYLGEMGLTEQDIWDGDFR